MLARRGWKLADWRTMDRGDQVQLIAYERIRDKNKMEMLKLLPKESENGVLEFLDVMMHVEPTALPGGCAG